jgi:hypothetical protein
MSGVSGAPSLLHVSHIDCQQMKMRIILLALFIAALLATLILALGGLGLRPLSGFLICLYVAGAVASFIFISRLSDKEKLETPWILWFFISNEFALILFVLFWPALAPLALAEILFRAKSSRQSKRIPDDAKPKI